MPTTTPPARHSKSSTPRTDKRQYTPARRRLPRPGSRVAVPPDPEFEQRADGGHSIRCIDIASMFWVVDNGTARRGQAAINRLVEQFPNAINVHTPVHASWLYQVVRHESHTQAVTFVEGGSADAGDVAFGQVREDRPGSAPYSTPGSARDLSRTPPCAEGAHVAAGGVGLGEHTPRGMPAERRDLRKPPTERPAAAQQPGATNMPQILSAARPRSECKDGSTARAR